MKRLNKYIFLPTLVLSMLIFVGCDKNKPYPITEAPGVVHFASDATGQIKISSASVAPLTVVVGTSDVQNVDREVDYTVTSPTGAVAGKEYTLSPSGKLTIPAGQSTANIVIQADSNYFPPGKNDTLIFTLVSSGNLPVAEFDQTKTVVISGPCDDADVTLSTMGGTFKNTKDADGTYSVSVTGLTETSPTTGTGMIANLWGDIAPVQINFDWTDPDNIMVTIPNQYMGYDYDDGQPFTIRTSPGKVSTFSVCSQNITLYVDFLVNNYPSPGSAAYYEKEFKINVNR